MGDHLRGRPRAERPRIEGYSAEEIAALPDSDLDALVFTGEPLVVHIGTASILGQFRKEPHRLVVELAQVEEGGEGVLLALSSAVHRYALSRSLSQVDWIVHAVSCARPNLKLRRVLTRRGFVVQNVSAGVEAYRLVETVRR